METKSCELSIKQVSEGKVIATLAKIGVIDRDGDVLKDGLLNGGQIVAIKPQHKWDHVNLGVAHVYEKSGTMEASMEFNMAIPSAKDWFESIRFSHEKNHRQQYSFGFHPTDFERGVHDGKSVRFLKQIDMAEVSPVLIGASIGSATLSVKEDELRSMATDSPSQESRGVESEHPPVQTTEVPDPGSDVKRLISPHTTATDDRPWNFAIEHRQVKTSMSAGYYRNLFAVCDAAKEDRRASYRYLHHRLTADGQAGAASVIACSHILHTLHHGLIPPDERKSVYDHMAHHLRDAGIEPPALGDIDSYVYPYDEEAKLFLWHAEDYLLQTGNIHDLRAKKGQTLKQAQIDHFKAIDEKFQALRLLLSLKELDRPFSELVEHMTVEARGEAVATRMQQVGEKLQQDAKANDRAMTDAVIARLLPKLH